MRKAHGVSGRGLPSPSVLISSKNSVGPSAYIISSPDQTKSFPQKRYHIQTIRQFFRIALERELKPSPHRRPSRQSDSTEPSLGYMYPRMPSINSDNSRLPLVSLWFFFVHSPLPFTSSPSAADHRVPPCHHVPRGHHARPPCRPPDRWGSPAPRPRPRTPPPRR